MMPSDAMAWPGVRCGAKRSTPVGGGTASLKSWGKGERMSVAGAEGVFGGLARGVPHVVQARRVTGGKGGFARHH